MLEKLRACAGALKIETYAIYIAACDPRTPWYTKALIFLVVAYTFSPIDLIPEKIQGLWFMSLVYGGCFA